MFKALLARCKQGFRTQPFPKIPPVLAERYQGCPHLHAALCAQDCSACLAVCPTTAIQKQAGKIRLDLGKCIFCGACETACPKGSIRFSDQFAMASRSRQDLMLDHEAVRLAKALDQKTRRIFGRSLRLRQVSAGGCNACEADVNVLGTVGFDLARFGIQFVASPRHADGLLITGPVSINMQLALKKTYTAVPSPKLVIATGSCAISGGPYAGHPEVHNGVDALLPVDLYIPGCPPNPYTILDGLLRLLGRI